MANESSSEHTVADVLARLRETAQLLREADHLDPKSQQLLADLVEELTRTLEAQTMPAEKASHLAECAAHLMQSVHQKEESHVIADARARLEKAVVAVETLSPILAGLFERLLDALASLGI